MYRTAETKLWFDKRFRVLPAVAKYLFLYLFQNDHAHVSGIYYIADVTIAVETGLNQSQIQKAWEALLLPPKSNPKLEFRPMISRCPETNLVWVHAMLKRQGRGIKLLQSAVRQIRSIEHFPWLKEFSEHYPEIATALTLPARNIPPMGYPAQDFPGPQEQEQEKEQENTGGISASAEIAEKKPPGKRGRPAKSDPLGPHHPDREAIGAIYGAYPRKVEPAAAKPEIAKALAIVRARGVPDPAAWLKRQTELFAEARRRAAQRDPDALKMTVYPARWFKRGRYDEDPATWEIDALSGSGTNGNGNPHGHARTPERGRAENLPL